MSVGHGNKDAAAGGDYGQLRASNADREQVIDLLKAAFVQGRLTRDELDALVGRALAVKTYAQLAAVTADVPAAPAVAAHVPESGWARTPPPVNKVVRSRAGAAIAAGVAAAFVLAALAALDTGAAGARPDPYLAACRTFFMWAPQNPGNNNIKLLNSAVAEARQGQDEQDVLLTGALLGVQQSVQQNDQNGVDAGISQVTAICSNNDA